MSPGYCGRLFQLKGGSFTVARNNGSCLGATTVWFLDGVGSPCSLHFARKQYLYSRSLQMALNAVLTKVCLNDSFARSNLSNWFSPISCLWNYLHASHDFLKCIHYPKLILFKDVDWIWTVLCIWSLLFQQGWQIIVRDQIYHTASFLLRDWVKAVLDMKVDKRGLGRLRLWEWEEWDGSDWWHAEMTPDWHTQAQCELQPIASLGEITALGWIPCQMSSKSSFSSIGRAWATVELVPSRQSDLFTSLLRAYKLYFLTSKLWNIFFKCHYIFFLWLTHLSIMSQLCS